MRPPIRPAVGANVADANAAELVAAANASGNAERTLVADAVSLAARRRPNAK
jgi:hypothetical protein